jgi:hypothetical protein
MRSTLLISLVAATSLCAQVHFTPVKKDGAVAEINVQIGGKPFTTFHYGADLGKPFLAPVRSASGKIVTRGFPMENIPGESRDHLHHTGLWFSYDDVNGIKFWENHPSYTKPHMGRIVVTNTEFHDGDHTGTLIDTNEWRDPAGKVLLIELRKITFPVDPKLRIIDFEITLTAAQDVTFGDTKEGAFAIRLAEPFTERKGGLMVNAEGMQKMANVWGKRSNWVDYTAVVGGERLGVAIFDHPQNPRHPTYWHARDYGLFALDPFGRQAFDPKVEESRWNLPKGQKLTFLWRVIIHPGDAETGHVADLYQKYASELSAAKGPDLPGLRIEPTSGGSIFYVKNTASEPLTAFLIELVNYPGSSYSFWQDAMSAVDSAEAVPPGVEKRIPVANMTVGAAPDYVKVQAAIFADGTSAGLPDKVTQLVERRRATLAATRDLVHRLEQAQSAGALAADLKQWAQSLEPQGKSRNMSQEAINQAAERTLILQVIARLDQHSVEDTLTGLRASERSLAESKPAL